MQGRAGLCTAHTENRDRTIGESNTKERENYAREWIRYITQKEKSRRLLLLKRSIPLYLLILPSLILLVVFTYIPMYGVTIAFKDYKTGLGIFGSEWVGFENFTTFFQLLSVLAHPAEHAGHQHFTPSW